MVLVSGEVEGRKGRVTSEASEKRRKVRSEGGREEWWTESLMMECCVPHRMVTSVKRKRERAGEGGGEFGGGGEGVRIGELLSGVAWRWCLGSSGVWGGGVGRVVVQWGGRVAAVIGRARVGDAWKWRVVEGWRGG